MQIFFQFLRTRDTIYSGAVIKNTHCQCLIIKFNSIMKKIILSIVLLLGMVFSVMAQDTYEWKKYRIKATVPEGMQELQNDANGLVLAASNFTFGLTPFKNAKKLDKLTEEEIQQLVAEMCNEMKMETANLDGGEFDCKNGEGIFFMSNFKEKEGWYALFSFVGSETTNKYAVVAMCFEADLAELVDSILANIEFY